MLASVYATFASAEEAERIGRTIIEERLAACVNILGHCTSIFRWNGQVERAQEVAAIFKTSADQAQALVARIAGLHSYDVPAIVAWPVVKSTPDCAAWVIDSVRTDQID